VVKGRRVPVVDIRARLAVKPGPSRPNATVLLVEMREITGLPMLGILADRMTDVCDFRERDFREHVIQQRPHGKPYGRPKTLLTLEKMFSPDEIAELKSIF
jgi:chemotaxis signal transduction protein